MCLRCETAAGAFICAESGFLHHLKPVTSKFSCPWLPLVRFLSVRLFSLLGITTVKICSEVSECWDQDAGSQWRRPAARSLQRSGLKSSVWTWVCVCGRVCVLDVRPGDDDSVTSDMAGMLNLIKHNKIIMTSCWIGPAGWRSEQSSFVYF